MWHRKSFEVLKLQEIKMTLSTTTNYFRCLKSITIGNFLIGSTFLTDRSV